MPVDRRMTAHSGCGVVVAQQVASEPGATCAGEVSAEILTVVAPHRVDVIAAILRGVELDQELRPWMR